MRIAALALLMMMPLSAATADEDLWKVYLFSRDSVSDCILDSVSENALFVTSHGNRIPVPLDSVATLLFERRSHVGREATNGLLVGAVVGGALGYLASREDKEEAFIHFSPTAYITLGVFGGMMYGYGIGAIVGAFHAIDSRYNVRGLDRHRKRDLILQILTEYAPPPSEQD